MIVIGSRDANQNTVEILDGGIILSVDGGIAGWPGRVRIAYVRSESKLDNINREIPFETPLATPVHHVSGAYNKC